MPQMQWLGTLPQSGKSKTAELLGQAFGDAVKGYTTAKTEKEKRIREDEIENIKLGLLKEQLALDTKKMEQDVKLEEARISQQEIMNFEIADFERQKIELEKAKEEGVTARALQSYYQDKSDKWQSFLEDERRHDDIVKRLDVENAQQKESLKIKLLDQYATSYAGTLDLNRESTTETENIKNFYKPILEPYGVDIEVESKKLQTPAPAAPPAKRSWWKPADIEINAETLKDKPPAFQQQVYAEVARREGPQASRDLQASVEAAKKAGGVPLRPGVSNILNAPATAINRLAQSTTIPPRYQPSGQSTSPRRGVMGALRTGTEDITENIGAGFNRLGLGGAGLGNLLTMLMGGMRAPLTTNPALARQQTIQKVTRPPAGTSTTYPTAEPSARTAIVAKLLKEGRTPDEIRQILLMNQMPPTSRTESEEEILARLSQMLGLQPTERTTPLFGMPTTPSREDILRRLNQMRGIQQ